MKRPQLLRTVIAGLLSLCCILSFSSGIFADGDAPSHWAAAAVERARELGLIPPGLDARYTSDITRAEFCALAVRTYEALRGTIDARAAFDDCDDTDVAKLGGLGVIAGTGGGAFDPSRGIQREEAAVLLCKLAEVVDCPPSYALPLFDDIESIAPWALPYVGRVRNGGIMSGVGGNMFDPKSGYTIEQSITTLLIVYDMATAERLSVNDDASRGRRIPILMYHAIADTPSTGLTDLYVRPSELEAQLKYLADNGYQTITFPDLDNIGAYAKPVMITFDDGYRDNYTILFPLLKKYNLKATIFIITGSVWGSAYLTADMITEMSDSGLVSIQSHTVSHENLTVLSRSRLRDEMERSHDYISRLTGTAPVALCYPSGSYNETVKLAAAEFYGYAVLNIWGTFTCGGDLFAMRRIRVGRGTGVAGFRSMLGN